jgi:hypothetical protein
MLLPRLRVLRTAWSEAGYVEGRKVTIDSHQSAPGGAPSSRGGAQRLGQNPEAMRLRRQTAEHPFGTLKRF